MPRWPDEPVPLCVDDLHHPDDAPTVSCCFAKAGTWSWSVLGQAWLPVRDIRGLSKSRRRRLKDSRPDDRGGLNGGGWRERMRSGLHLEAGEFHAQRGGILA